MSDEIRTGSAPCIPVGSTSPPGVEDLYDTCYTADEQTGAFVETFGHDRDLPDPVPRVVAVSDITHPARPLQLADARNHHGLGLFGLTGSISTGGDLDTLATCQRWALAWHLSPGMRPLADWCRVGGGRWRQGKCQASPWTIRESSVPT